MRISSCFCASATLPRYFPSALALLNTFSLTPPSVLVIFSGNGGQHIQHHAIHGLQHAAGKIITDDAGQRQMAGWQGKTDDGQLFVGNLLSQYLPSCVIQTGQSVNLLNKDYIVGFSIIQQAYQFRPVHRGA